MKLYTIASAYALISGSVIEVPRIVCQLNEIATSFNHV